MTGSREMVDIDIVDDVEWCCGVGVGVSVIAWNGMECWKWVRVFG